MRGFVAAGMAASDASLVAGAVRIMGGRARDDNPAVTRPDGAVRIVGPSPRHITSRVAPAVAPRIAPVPRVVAPGAVVPTPRIVPIPRVVPVPGSPSVHGVAPGERPVPRVIPSIRTERTVPVVPQGRGPAVDKIIVGHVSQIFAGDERIGVQMKGFRESGEILLRDRFRLGFSVAGASCVDSVIVRVVIRRQLRERPAGRKHHSDAC